MLHFLPNLEIIQTSEKNIKASEGMQMKQLKEDIALLDEKLGKLEDTVRTERKEMDAKLAELLEPHQDELDALEKEYKAAQARVQEINAEFVKDRSAEE